ncbi:hypothetical protein PSHT_04118 [Puccinia striiformis]|uniref:Uncharacterized protein n=1 Tax=Puccinia striiformis TaxID=27350 RepID=A0A2S4WE10_9BASI|nr:hypothetical protein PSHT_04118 [Puccinia striiformis]
MKPGPAIMPGIELDSLSDELSYLTSSINLDLSETQSQPQSQSQTNPVVKDSTSDDLIPSDDPCYHNLKLRNLSTILSFILSLLDGDQVVHHQSTATQNSFSIDDQTRHSIINLCRIIENLSLDNLVLKLNYHRTIRTSFPLSFFFDVNFRRLLETRSKILEDFENELNKFNKPNVEWSYDHQDVDDQDQSSSPSINPLSERLNEKFVSQIVQEKLENLITNDYVDYSGQSDSRCVKICIVLFIGLFDLISFSALVYSWNKLFNLILSSTITSSSSSSSSSDLP